MNLDYIEDTVCECTNKVVRSIRPDCNKFADRLSLYNGSTKVAMCVAIARQISYMVMHDMYGVPYSTISRRAHISKRRILSGINRARTLSFTDFVYKNIRDMVCERL